MTADGDNLGFSPGLARLFKKLLARAFEECLGVGRGLEGPLAAFRVALDERFELVCRRHRPRLSRWFYRTTLSTLPDGRCDSARP